MFLSDLWSLQNASIWKGLTGRNVGPSTSFLRYSVKQDWNLIDLFAMKFWNTLFQIEFWQKSLGSIYSLVSIWEAEKKVNFRTVMVQPWGVELCNFPIWYDKGIIDLVTLIPTFCCIEGSKNGFLLPAFPLFFYLYMSPRLSSHYR